MNGHIGWKNPRFEDFEYTSWLPEDDALAWLGNGCTVAELTGVGDTTNYMDYKDVSKVLPVPTKDYVPPVLPAFGHKPLGEVNGAETNLQVLEQQHAASEQVDGNTIPNTALDAKAPAGTCPAGRTRTRRRPAAALARVRACGPPPAAATK